MSNIPDISQDANYRGGKAIFDRIHVLDKIVYNFATDDITTRNLTVTGIATFGTSSTVIDGATDTIQVGTALTIGHTQGLQFHTQNLHTDGFEVNQVNISGIATIGSDLYLTGALVDTSGDTGSSGQLLASTGSGTNWINANSTSVLNAVNVGVNLNSTNGNQFISFFGASSGNQPNRVDSQFLYNPSTNTMSGINYSGTSTFTNTKVTGIATAAILEVEGQLRDGDGNFGSAGQVLTSDGTDTKWDASSNLPAGSSAQIAITDVSSGTPRLLLATGSGTQKDVLSNSSLTYNTSTQVIAGKISSISNHDTDDFGVGIFTVGSAQMTQPQLKVGRDQNQYWGVYTDDRNAHLVHRQDETSGIMTTRFDQWDSNTSDTTGKWEFRSGDGTGGSMTTALTLDQSGAATFSNSIGSP